MRVPDLVRRVLLRLAPWWDETTERDRRHRATRAHIHAIRARIAAEQIAARYARYDAAMRK